MPLVIGQNSYVDEDFSNAYLAGKTGYNWAALNAPQKESLLMLATSRVDAQILVGIKTDSTQKLEFPRMIDCEKQAAVPEAVKQAVCEEAFDLITRANSERAKLQRDGVKSFSYGNVSETFGSMPFAGTKLYSSEARLLLRPYLAGRVNIK
jgi:hypothetical protein